jgi:hypothetical protein
MALVLCLSAGRVGAAPGAPHRHPFKPWRPESPPPLLTKEGMEGRFCGVKGHLETPLHPPFARGEARKFP